MEKTIANVCGDCGGDGGTVGVIVDKEFQILFTYVSESGCAKKQIAAGTYVNGKFVYAVNTCRYEGDGCPRLHLPSGQGYELCKAVHAETALVSRLREMNQHSDGVAWVAAHYWACEPCASALREVGVREIRVRENV